MRTIYAAVLTLFLAATAAAQISTSVRTIPPDPVSRDAITLRIGGVWNDAGHPRCGAATVAGRTIAVALGCLPQVATPAVLTPWSLDVFAGVLDAGIYDIIVSTPTTLSIATRKLIVQEATPQFTVTPNVLVSGSGERVTLQGAVLRCADSPGAACLAPIVRFGTQHANLELWEQDRMVVIPPPGSGTVDVSIDNTQIRRVAAFHYADVQKPPTPEFFTPLLVPVFFSGPGALGSRWDTELSGRNDNAYRYWSPYDAPFNHWCFICDPPPPQGLPANASGTIRASASLVQQPQGMLGHIQRQGSENVHYGLLVRDLSRQSEALGAEVPVVREDELFDNRSFSLLNVPSDSRFRTALRVYTIEGSGSFRLVIKPMFGDDVLVDTEHITTRPAETPYGHGFLVIGHLVASYPALAGHGPLRIEVIPRSPGGSRIWGFATVTNNETQHVTVISPQ